MPELTRDEAAKMFRPDWTRGCDNCKQKPVVPASGLCGPCHFGTTDALLGEWWDDQEDDFDEQFAEEHLPEA